MFKRKLNALGYPKSSTFDPSVVEQCKELVIWLEDQKIRHYKVENRVFLKTANAKSWPAALEKYLKDVDYPFTKKNQNMVIDWLLGLAVRLEYGDDVEKYNSVSPEKVEKPKENGASAKSPLQDINEKSMEFRTGVRSLAKVLDIPIHPDDTVTLEAVKILIEERLSTPALEAAKTTSKPVGRAVPIDDIKLGFDTGDPMINKAAKALRLLHINELRKLQTQVNEAIVAVQAITANPKTDQRLGKIGR
uniref:RNA transcription, translation and transport factor protein n=2 Tax=Ciona intestinalis TaxID=7719 RepID=F7BMD5_CIOIN